MHAPESGNGLEQEVQQCLLHPTRRCAREAVTSTSFSIQVQTVQSCVYQQPCLRSPNNCVTHRAASMYWARLGASSQAESVAYTAHRAVQKLRRQGKLIGNKKESVLKVLPKGTNWVKELGFESPLSCPPHTRPGPKPLLTIIVAFLWRPQTNSFQPQAWKWPPESLIPVLSNWRRPHHMIPVRNASTWAGGGTCDDFILPNSMGNTQASVAVIVSCSDLMGRRPLPVKELVL